MEQAKLYCTIGADPEGLVVKFIDKSMGKY